MCNTQEFILATFFVIGETFKKLHIFLAEALAGYDYPVLHITVGILCAVLYKFLIV
jgi:hypothetical protein